MKLVSDNASSANGSGHIQTVSRACRILLDLATEGDGRKATTIASDHSLTLPTTHHLLTTLVSEGFLAKDSGRRYYLGPKIAVLAEAFQQQPSIPEHFVIKLRKLAETTGETAYLSGWHRGEIRVLTMAEGTHAVRVAGLRGGYQDNAHARASGKLLLAFASGAVCRAYLESHPLTPVTPNTITEQAAFKEELETIRSVGYAIDEGEFVTGVACVAAPILESGVAVAAATLSAPMERFVHKRLELTDATVRTANSMSSDSTESVVEAV